MKLGRAAHRRAKEKNSTRGRGEGHVEVAASSPVTHKPRLSCSVSLLSPFSPLSPSFSFPLSYSLSLPPPSSPSHSSSFATGSLVWRCNVPTLSTHGEDRQQIMPQCPPSSPRVPTATPCVAQHSCSPSALKQQVRPCFELLPWYFLLSRFVSTASNPTCHPELTRLVDIRPPFYSAGALSDGGTRQVDAAS